MTSDTQLAKLSAFWFDPGNLEVAYTAMAIALAESGGNARNLNNNPSTRDLSYGLWQINMYGDLGPARRKQFGLRNNEELYDENKNAEVAGEIYRSQGFSAWGAYNNGNYKKFLDRAKNATGANPGQTPITGETGDLPLSERIGDTLNINPLDAFSALVAPLQQVVDALLKAGLWIGNPDNWVRVIQVTGGIILGAIAISIVASPITKSLPI